MADAAYGSVSVVTVSTDTDVRALGDRLITERNTIRTALGERWANDGCYVVGAIGGVEQGFGASIHVPTVQQQLANVAAEFTATRLKGSNNFARKTDQMSFEQICLG